MSFERYALIIFVLSVIIPAPAWSETSYEAAGAVLTRGAVFDGKRITRVGGDDDGTVSFTNVAVFKAGLYPVTVHFLNIDDASLNISVNGEACPRTVIFRRKGPATNISSQTILIPLREGSNSIAFDNSREFGPDLAGISVADEPVESHRIFGAVRKENGASVPGAEVLLSGAFERRAVSDANGRYEFNFLPSGRYHVVAKKDGWIFSPGDQFIPALTVDHARSDFVALPFPSLPPNPAVMESGRWRIVYDLANGVADIFCDGRTLLKQVHAAVQLPETVTSMNYSRRTLARHRVNDNFGKGTEFDITCANSESDKMIQSFWLYDKADYFLTRVKIMRKHGAASNFMAPLVTDRPVEILPGGDNRALWVPFDNDKWVRYNSIPFGGNVTSYEVSALYHNESREGLVVGSVDHDTWKTGVRSSTSGNTLNQLEVFAGITSAATRDTLPHGKISGTAIESPRVFVGYFSDWRMGLETFAKANAAVAPPRPWTKGVPFGWNSWGKLAFNVTFQKALEVSDFFAAELQPHHFENNNTVYIGLDAGWNKFSDDQLKQFVKHCRANHQEAGIYFTPFTDWGSKSGATVEGSHYHYRDIWLYANGNRQRIAGGVALDPTHPGTKARIKYNVERFKKFGFKYVKADFMVHGSLEGDHFYDRRVTTGLQAYNAGMKYLDRCLGRSMYLNLAISPLFPSQYANSRRIACDAWGDIAKVEYTLNAVTYGWWLGSLYDYNDPDHVVLGGYTDGENRARVTSAVVTGLFITGDDFSKAGDLDGKARAKMYLTNPDIDALARLRKPFHPYEGNTGNRAANIFVCEDQTDLYLAAFNYSQSITNIPVSWAELGLKTDRPIEARELWSGRRGPISSPLEVPPADVVLYQVFKSQKSDKQRK